MKTLSSPIIILIVFSTYLSFIVIDMINWAIPIMAIFSLYSIFFRKITRTEIWIYSLICIFLFSTYIVNEDSTRSSSAIYSIIFFIIFLSYLRGIHQNELSLTAYLKYCKYIVYAYCICLMLQQICVLIGIPVFNQILDYTDNQWKLSSLSDEPSHTSRIIGLITFSYIHVFQLITKRKYDITEMWRKKKDILFWISFFWIMLTIQSSTAYLFIVILFLQLFVLSGKLKIGHIIFATFIIVSFLSILKNNPLIERNIKIIEATYTLDEKKIVDADNSGAHRIVPLIILAKNNPIEGLNGLFGYGMDKSKEIILNNFPGYMDENIAGGGGIFQIWYEFGILLFLVYLIGSFKLCVKKNDFLSLLFWFLLVFMNSLNSQIVWLSIMLLYTNKFFEKKMKYNYGK